MQTERKPQVVTTRSRYSFPSPWPSRRKRRILGLSDVAPHHLISKCQRLD